LDQEGLDRLTPRTDIRGVDAVFDGELGSLDEDLGSSETANPQGCRRAWA